MSGKSGFRTGPFGAAAVTEIDGVVIPEARVSVIGTVPQWDWHFVFEEATIVEVVE